jgi:hypothetical protein
MPTRPNRPHQNKRKQPAIADRTRSVAKALSTHIYINLIQVSVPAEDGTQQSATFTNNNSHMPLRDQHFHAHSKSYKLLTNNKITPPTTKAYTT